MEVHQIQMQNEAAAQSAQKQKETMQQLLSIHAAFIRLYADQKLPVIELSSRLRSTNPKVADNLDEQLDRNQKQISRLTSELFSPEKLKQLLNLHATPDYLNDSDCLVLFMLATKIGNTQIAALLNTSGDSFKARKYHLKKKITQKAQDSPDHATLLSLF